MNTLTGMVGMGTGASSGIGEGIAKMLAAEGVKVSLSARRVAKLQRVADEIRQQGSTALIAPADLGEEQALRDTLRQTEKTLGLVDILVNSGGVIHVSPIHELDMRDWDLDMNINLRAPAVLCSAVLPGMRQRKRGYIVNIASEAGVFFYGGMGAYAVSKHALRVLTELIQEENQGLGIKAWAICPGFVDTPLADWAPWANRKKMLTVEEIVDIVRFLLTQGSNVKMGAEILVRTFSDPGSTD